MSDRLLKESDVIEVVTQYISCDYPTEEMAREDAEVLIGRTPSADRPREWIPCSKRLPEDNERVLVTTAWGYVTIGRIKQNIWSTDLIVNLQDFVLAWMPLPKPWKGADDD